VNAAWRAFAVLYCAFGTACAQNAPTSGNRDGVTELGPDAQVGPMAGGVADVSDGLLPTPPEVTLDAAPQPADQTENQSVCGEISLTTQLENVTSHANLLVVFDRSNSMNATWNGSPKYAAASTALLDAITPLGAHLTVGSILFPSVNTQAAPVSVGGSSATDCPSGCDPLNLLHWLPGSTGCCLDQNQNAATTTALVTNVATCDVNPITNADQIDFTSVDAFAAQLPGQFPADGSANGTPLQAAIERAAEALSSHTFSDKLIVLVMTDGEPNCNTSQNAVLTQIQDWQRAAIQTYVVGLPGATAAATLLNAMAQAGGTDRYVDTSAPQELEAHLREVVESTVRRGWASCNFSLDPPTEVPERLRVFVTQNGQERTVASGADAFVVSDAGDQVTLQGTLCQQAMSGALEALRFEYGCPDPSPITPD